MDALALDFFTSPDVLLCLITGAVIGALAGQILPGRGLGLIGNIVLGAVGGAVGGFAFDLANIIDVGDVMDPIIAAAVGSGIVLAIASALRR